MSKRSKVALLAGLVLAGSVQISPALAAPQIGSPLIGAFCATGAAIRGAGATFANNAQTKVFIPAYAAACNKGSVTYLSSGSGDGKTQFNNRTVAFGGSDEPLTTDEFAFATGDLGTATAPNPQGRVGAVHHIPLALGAVTVSYNLASCGIGAGLNFRSQVVSAIYSGLVKNWNDPLLVADNANLANCNKAIKPAARSDGSGTTYVFKDYLSKRNPHFNIYKQPTFNLNWPIEDLGQGVVLRGNGNGGVATVVKTTDGAIGYVELSTANKNALTYGKADGPHAQFLSPNSGLQANCDLAAVGATTPAATLSPGWDTVSITDSPNPLAYPVCSFTYALVYNNLVSGGKLTVAQAATLADFLGIALEDSTQANLPAQGYGKLPVTIQTIGKVGVATLIAS